MTAIRQYVTTFDEAWQQFQAHPTTDDASAHAIDQRRRDEKSSYIAFLVPVTGHGIVQATRPVREALTAAGISEALPSHFLHVTVLGIGFEAALRATNGNIARIMDRASRALRDVQPLTLTLRGVNSFGNAAFVEVHDDKNSLPALRDRLVGVLHQIGLAGFGNSALSGEGATPDGEAERDQADAVNAPPFLPHLSLCYYREHYPTEKVAEILEPYRDLEVGTLRMNYVTLAAVPHSDFDHFPPLTRIADLLIG
ncbi:MAG: 2'-5' RNA ligase family protein [Thermomicrobia bacterium]|nr:2'-5' RNA ligase family protein [Thermomicrobia bacterium]